MWEQVAMGAHASIWWSKLAGAINIRWHIGRSHGRVIHEGIIANPLLCSIRHGMYQRTG
jgi:hypothetical protein